MPGVVFESLECSCILVMRWRDSLYCDLYCVGWGVKLYSIQSKPSG